MRPHEQIQVWLGSCTFVLTQVVRVLTSMLTAVSACYLQGSARWPNCQTQLRPFGLLARCSGVNKQMDLVLYSFLTGVCKVTKSVSTQVQPMSMGFHVMMSWLHTKPDHCLYFPTISVICLVKLCLSLRPVVNSHSWTIWHMAGLVGWMGINFLRFIRMGMNGDE